MEAPNIKFVDPCRFKGAPAKQALFQYAISVVTGRPCNWFTHEFHESRRSGRAE